MFNIDRNGIISITRGDTASFPLFINKGTKAAPLRYCITEQDEIYLGVSEPNHPFEDALIKHKYTKSDTNKLGDVVIYLEHDDTKLLMPGKYFYEIKGKIYNSKREKYEVVTIVSKREFFIEE